MKKKEKQVFCSANITLWVPYKQGSLQPGLAFSSFINFKLKSCWLLKDIQNYKCETLQKA